MKVSDVFLNVPVRGGDDWSVACLIEQQHENDKGFGARVFDSYICLRAQRPPGRTTVFVIYTGDSKNVNNYTETCYGLEATIKFRAFHLPSCAVEELRSDNRPFARVMYAGRMSYESGDDVALREKYALELLSMADDVSYDNSQRKFILEFSERIFRLQDSRMNNELREAYNVKTVPLRELSIELSKEEGIMIGKEEGITIGKEIGKEANSFDVARAMLADGLPAETIRKYTGLDQSSILSLR
jgi:hypothetical protein